MRLKGECVNMQIIFEASDKMDLGGSGILEAAVDAFSIRDEPYPLFIANNIACPFDEIEFSHPSDSILNYFWTFEGGNPENSSLSNPIVRTRWFRLPW